MKKIMFVLAVVAIASVSQASAVMWKYNGTADQVGWDVFALTSMPDEITSTESVSGAAKSSGKVAKSGRVYNTSGTIDGFSEASGSKVDYFLVLVGNNGTDDYYYQIAQSGTTFDPTSTDQPVQAEYNGANIAAVGGDGWVKIGTGGGGDPDPGPGPVDPDPPTPGPGGDGDVPEPTSGILLMIGGAALALRRRR